MSELEIARVEPLFDLERQGALKRNGLVLPNTITYEQYEAVGKALGEVHEVLCWAVGDWINAGEDLFKEEHSQAWESLDLSEEQRTQYSRVARRFKPEERVMSLTFSHHRVVAVMKDERARADLLKRAADARWTVRELEAAKKDAPIGELPGPSLDWRYTNLRRAAERVVNTKDMLADGKLYAVPVSVLDELAAAIDVR